jgi:hypothetical protein
MPAKPTNLAELRNDLLDAYLWVKEDPRRANQVKEMVNAAGKVIGTLKVELEYNMLRGEMPEIPFISTEKRKPMGRGSVAIKSLTSA